MGAKFRYAHALDTDEDAFRGVKIISMGGTLAWEEEFNYAANPEATRRMLRDRRGVQCHHEHGYRGRRHHGRLSAGFPLYMLPAAHIPTDFCVQTFLFYLY